MPIGSFRRRDTVHPTHQHEGDPTSFYQHHVDSFVTSIKNNTYHLLDSSMKEPLQKLHLPDGTIIFTVHPTITDLISAILPQKMHMIHLTKIKIPSSILLTKKSQPAKKNGIS